MKNIDDLIYEIEKVKQKFLLCPNIGNTRNMLRAELQVLYDKAYELKIIDKQEEVHVRTMTHDPKTLDVYTIPKGEIKCNSINNN